MRGEDQQSRVFYELCALLFTVLRSPHVAIPCAGPTAPGSADRPPRRRPSMAVTGSRQPRRSQMTPVGFASLLLGISLALMLCGSVTFVIGFIMMPWVLGMLMLFYFVGIVSSLSGLGRAILCPASPSSRSSQKEMIDNDGEKYIIGKMR